jgi:hypothetical protein
MTGVHNGAPDAATAKHGVEAAADTSVLVSHGYAPNSGVRPDTSGT